MADIEQFERSQNRSAAKRAKDAGNITDRGEHKGRKNFRGPSESKSGLGVSPKASGSPWSYGRSDQSEGKDYSQDYSRKGSSERASGPFKPSDKIPGNVTGAGKSNSTRDTQTSDHV